MSISAALRYNALYHCLFVDSSRCLANHLSEPEGPEEVRHVCDGGGAVQRLPASQARHPEAQADLPPLQGEVSYLCTGGRGCSQRSGGPSSRVIRTL